MYMLPAHLLINPETCQHIMTITYVVQDLCGNQSFCVQKVTYKKVNNLPPQPSIPIPDDITICGPIPPAPNYDTLDACGIGYPSLIASSIQNGPCNDGNGCIVTRSWIVRSCGGFSISRNQTITIDCDFAFETNIATHNSGHSKKSAWQVSIAPNPGVDYANIIWTSTNEKSGSIKVMNLSGSVLIERNVDYMDINSSMRIDLSAFTAGMYLIEVSSASERIVQKWVKN